MLKGFAVIAIFAFMHYYIYKRISPPIAVFPRGKLFLKIFLVFAGTIYIISQLLHFTFAISMHHIYTIYPLIYGGFLWILALPTLCALCFLEKGLSMVFPRLTHWWLRGITIIFILRLLFLMKKYPYGREIPSHGEISGRAIIFAIYLIVAVILYKIITATLNLPNKKKGSLIIIFSMGPILAFFGIEVAVISLIFGFYAVVFARISAGLELSKKSRRCMIIFLCMGIIMSLPHVFWLGNILAIPFAYYIGGAWHGLIITAFTLFLLESGIAFIYPSHPQVRVITTLTVLALVSGYGLINGLQVPTVKEIIIPIKNLPADVPNFTIVQWSDIHLGNLVSPQWFKETTAKTNHLKPDLLVITGDMLDKGFDKTYIESLKQVKTKFGILAAAGNHEYYFNRFNIFLETAKATGIRVLRNECITLPNGIQIAGINDPTAPDFGDIKPSVTKTLKNSDPQKPLILLSHRAQFFPEAALHGVDLQLSGHNHIGQIPPLDLFIYLTLKYSYGLFREGNSYIYTSCGTGIWSIPMRFLTHNEITRITLKRE